MDKRVLKKSFLASIGRLIGVVLGAGAGSLIKELVGPGFTGWGVAMLMATVSFLLIWETEYMREKLWTLQIFIPFLIQNYSILMIQ